MKDWSRFMHTLSLCVCPHRSVGGAQWHEHQAGRDPEIPGHVPGDQAADLPPLLLPVQRRPSGDPGSVQKPQSRPAASQEVLRQHQEPGYEQGISKTLAVFFLLCISLLVKEFYTIFPVFWLFYCVVVKLWFAQYNLPLIHIATVY